MADNLHKAIVIREIVASLLVGPARYIWCEFQRQRVKASGESGRTIIKQTVSDVILLARRDEGNWVASGERVPG